jgi:Ca2+-binding EF-hand superfamily protein
LNLLKNQIKLDKEVEIQKENLFSNTVFNTIDAFKIFDSENSGYITEDDFARVSEELGLSLPGMDRVIFKFDKDQDGKLNYLEFCKALTPKNIIYTMGQNSRYNSYKRE